MSGYNPIVNESTSVINVNTRGLDSPGNPTAIVYISTTTTPGQFVTIRDQTGTLSSPQAILISTTGGASLHPIPHAGIGTTSTILNQRFSYLSLQSDPAGSDVWRPVNVSPFPDPATSSAFTRVLDVADTLTTSTVQTSLASSMQIRSQQHETRDSFQGSTYLYISTLYLNTYSQYLANPATSRATVAGPIKLYNDVAATGSLFTKSLVSTGGDFFASGNVSTKSGTFSVGSNMNLRGSFRSPRSLFTVQSTLTNATTAGIRDTALAQDSFSVGTTLRTAATISTPTLQTVTAAVSTLSFQAGQAIQSRPTGGFTFTTPSLTIPSTISSFLATIANTLQTPALSTRSFGPSTQTMRSMTFSAPTAIQNAAGSLTTSSIQGNALSLLTNLEAARILVGASTFTLQGGVSLLTDPVANGVSISYPPNASPAMGTSNISTSWVISSVGTNGTCFAPTYTVSTNFLTAERVQTTSLTSVHETIANLTAAGAAVQSGITLAGSTNPLFLLSNTPFQATGGSLHASFSTVAERVTASSLTATTVTSPGTIQFLGQSNATLSTGTTSSLAARSIATSSLSFTGGIVGNPALYSTINPSSPWLLASTFQMNQPPFTTTKGLGTYFYDMMFSAASNATAYYSIIDPMSRVPRALPTPYVNTVLGTGTAGYTGDGGPGSNATIGQVIGQPAADAAGTVYVGAKTLGWRLRQLAGPSGSTGLVSTVAGNYQFFYGDGESPLVAAFGPRLAVSIPRPGAVLITDVSNVRLRQNYYDVILDPRMQTIAGTGVQGYSGDGGLAATATFSNPGMTVANQTGSTIYLADTSNNMIRAITGSTISRYAGNTTAGASGDGGPALSALFRAPFGLAMSLSENLLITDRGNSVVRQVSTATGVTTLVAGSYTAGFSGDGGPATAAQLNSPRGIALDAASNVYIADTLNSRVRRVAAATGLIDTVAGTGTDGFSGDGGAPTSAQFSTLTGLATDSNGNLYVADTENHCIRYINFGANTITTVAGQGGQPGFAGDNSFAAFARLSTPTHVAVDPANGYYYIADEGNRRIRYVNPANGIIFTYAGNGSSASAGDGGPARWGVFGSVNSVAGDLAGSTLYIADGVESRIRLVNRASNLITTAVGTGTAGFSGDGGAAAIAQVSSPTTVVLDAARNVFFTDTNNQRVRRIDAATGVITTVAGDGTQGYGGDGDISIYAQLNTPRALAVDSTHSTLFIGDALNYRIRAVNLVTGIITTVAGTGTSGTVTTGAVAATSPIDTVTALTVDPTGTLYFADTATNGLWSIRPSDGTFQPTSQPSTIGTYLGDAAPLSNAYFSAPTGYACDPAGNFIICDDGNKRIRRTYTFGNSNFPRYLNLVFQYTNYFTNVGQATIRLNGHLLSTFNGSAQQNLSFSFRDSNIWDYPLLSSNPVFGDQTPWIEINVQSNTGYTKLAGLGWVNFYAGQEGAANTVDSNAGIVMNTGRLVFPYRNNGITLDNEFNDASTRSLTYTGALVSASDPALKEEIEVADLARCYETLTTLPLRTYSYSAAYCSTFHAPHLAAPRLGFLTTEVAPHFPHSLHDTSLPEWPSPFQTLDVSQIKAAHMGATKALVERIRRLEGQLVALRRR
jgi:sugar lactone lactonase YvrE